MRVEKIDFKGIVRVTPDTEPQGAALEEVINMRYEAGALKAIGRKVAVVGNTAYKRIIEHKTLDYVNLIAIIGDKVVRVDAFGDTLQEICSCVTEQTELSVLTNMLMVNDRSTAGQKVYRFKDNTYTLLAATLPNITKITRLPLILAGSGSSSPFEPEITNLGNNAILLREQLIAGVQEIRNGNKNYAEGYVFLSTNYTLFDNSETKMSPPELFILGDYTPKLFRKHVDSLGDRVNAGIMTHDLKISLTPPADLQDFKDLIKEINIYISYPISEHQLDADAIWLKPSTPPEGQGWTPGDYDYDNSTIKRASINTTTFENMLFYKQHSIDIREPLREFYQMVFGDELLTGKTMLVDSTGWNATVGRPFVYNNRLHLYDYKKSIITETQLFDLMSSQESIAEAFAARVCIRANNEEMVVVGQINGVINVTPATETEPEKKHLILLDKISFPDSRAYKIEVSGNGLHGTIQLRPSKTYNYAFAVREIVAYDNSATAVIVSDKLFSRANGICELLPGELDEVPEKRTYSESNVVIVSASSNPFYFPVENSYKIGGNIKDIAIMVEQISEAQTGQYPLVVLTDNGIFALEQGNGIVLYSNLVPISNDICERGAVQTQNGVVYIANNSVNLLKGREGLNLSFPLEEEPNLNIRTCNSFTLATKNINLYDISAYLSDIDFRDYLNGAILLTDSVREEIIVSNKQFSYSYVYGVKTQLWHKITGSFTQSSGRLALRTTQSGISPSRASIAQIVVSDLIIQESFTFIAANRTLVENGDTIIPSGITLSLFANNLQVASLQTQTAMPLYLCLEEMIGEIQTMELTYNTITKQIVLLTNDAALNTKAFAIKNIATTIASGLFAIYAQSVVIPRKGIAETISVVLNGTSIPLLLSAEDTYTTLATKIATAINVATTLVTATTIGNSVIIPSVGKGAAMNAYTLAVNSSLFCLLSYNTFSGAKDESVIASDAYVDVVDLTKEERTGALLTHVQTRPLKFDKEGYKSIYRAILRGELLPNTKPYGCYIFASNHLKGWELVSASQIGAEQSQMRLLRAMKSYKYFIVVIGGIVNMGHNITSMSVTIQEQLEGKDR